MNVMGMKYQEKTCLEEVNFPFNCFDIIDLETLPHWHNHTEIIYIRHGTCTVYLNGVAIICHEGDIILIPRASLHSILPHIPAEYSAIVIGDTLFTTMMQDLHCEIVLRPFLLSQTPAPFHIIRDHAHYSILENLILDIIKEDIDKKPCYQLLIKVSLCQFFTYLIRFFSVELNGQLEINHQKSNTQTIKTALRYLSEHYKEKITIKKLSSLSNMSDQHFCRLFKAYTGKTFIDYLTDLRLSYANRLLLHTDLPITQIPELTGFCNANYFARIYKSKYGHSPSYIRKNTAPPYHDLTNIPSEI